jgi:hypothetical protein
MTRKVQESRLGFYPGMVAFASMTTAVMLVLEDVHLARLRLRPSRLAVLQA